MVDIENIDKDKIRIDKLIEEWYKKIIKHYDKYGVLQYGELQYKNS